jgi:hypothetical protein
VGILQEHLALIDWAAAVGEVVDPVEVAVALWTEDDSDPGDLDHHQHDLPVPEVHSLGADSVGPVPGDLAVLPLPQLELELAPEPALAGSADSVAGRA